jgi:hypothetical protein
MNENISEVAKRVQKLLLRPADDENKAEWANVLGCGAPGPSREEAELFHQGAEDWELPS